jgi:hypothetical protein
MTRHDAFQPHLASVAEHDVAGVCEMLIELQPTAA